MKSLFIAEKDKQMIGNARQLFSLDEIESALNQVAEQMNQRLYGQPVTLITILQGGMVVTAHLLLKLNFPIQLDSLYATRYQNKTEGSQLSWKQYPSTDMKDKTVVLVDDIFDQGVTLSEVKKFCLAQGAKEVLTVVLLEKQHDRQLTVERPDYVALTVADHYVFGFGLDYAGAYRNALGIYAVSHE